MTPLMTFRRLSFYHQMMKILAIACDYDETIAPRGRIDEALLPGLSRLRALDLKTILVTGRELNDLRRVCGHLDYFDLVVAENGAVLFDPVSAKVELLVEPPPAAFLGRLQEMGVPFTMGHVIISTRQPHENEVLTAIKDLGMELHLIFNKGAVMVLPTSTNKAMGLKVALKRLDLSRHNVVGIGDAENDHSLLDYAGIGVAVSNAVENLKIVADLVTKGESSAGVGELIDLIADPSSAIHKMSPHRHGLHLDGRNEEARVDPSKGSILVMASKGKERDPAVHLITRELTKGGYQWCILNFAEATPRVPSATSSVLGSKPSTFTAAEIPSGLLSPFHSLVINFHLEGIQKPEVDAAFKEVHDFIGHRGRPHFLLVNEPEKALAFGISLQDILSLGDVAFIFVTGAASVVYRSNLPRFNTILAAGQSGVEALQEWCRDNDGCTEKFPDLPSGKSGAMLWTSGKAQPYVFALEELEETVAKSKPSLDAPLDQARQFCFRGPRGALSLSAPTIRQFLEMGAGVDADTWLYHFRKRDYSHWIDRHLGLSDLAAAVEKLEKNESFAPAEAREQLEKMVMTYLST